MSSEKTTEAFQDVSELLQTGEPIVLAVDQVPFEVESRGVKNTFCLLVPLMSDSGNELNRSQFRNRERVWWMLRPEIPAHQILVGTIWSGPIERSRAYGNPEKEKDHYQVRRAEIRPGARHLVEVLSINVAHPDLNELLSPEGIHWPYSPLERVIVRGGLSAVGPFHSTYDFESQRIRLRSLSEDDPHVYRLTQSEFSHQLEIREYSYTANRWDAKANEKEINLAFIKEEQLEVFIQRGERLDGATDTQIINWAFDFLEIPEESRDHFRRVLEHAKSFEGDVGSEEFKERLDRFRRLCEHRERIVSLGSEIARAVSTYDGFRELVTKHIDSITRDRIAASIDARRSEIADSLRDAEAELERKRETITGLDAEYARAVQAWEEKFQREHGERVRSLDERESTLSRHEQEMEQRLGRLIETYRDTSREFSDHLVAELPMLRRLGLLTTGIEPVRETSGTTNGPRATRGVSPERLEIELPTFLEKRKPDGAGGSIDEVRFLEQFRSVVGHHGFVFDAEDLANFHVLVETGQWTVLAGPSGLGKSSIPRFYAKALGAEEEFLMIPVRPDWLDDRDVIGAFNALSGRYEPAPSGLVDRLIAAQEDTKADRGGIYVICVDEMNLARVEHYFAQLLSVLEQPEGSRFLNLFSRGTVDPDDPYASYRKLELGSNIRLVGTVNVDETTHFFSPKVIDRCSIAHFERPDIREGLEEEDYVRTEPTITPVRLETYTSWIQAPDRSGEVVQFILRVEEILRRSRLGLGFRVRDRILRYVSSARALLGEERSIDFAFLQNVLPGLRPTAPRYMELLRDLRSLFPESRFRRTAHLLKALEDDPESDFFQLL
jgi:hypothetical protein